MFQHCRFFSGIVPWACDLNNPKNALPAENKSEEEEEHMEEIIWPEQSEEDIRPEHELNYPLMLNSVLPPDIRVVVVTCCPNLQR